MNRKAKLKANREISKQEKAIIAASKAKENKLHPFDDPDNWLKGGFEKPPWTDKEIQEYQKRLDSAFGAENAIVLAWSGDRRYGDMFLNERGEIERKPVLLFAEVPVNDRDYLYISVPRWVLLEVVHGSQLEDSWEASSTYTDSTGVKVQIRPEKPPEFMYQHFKIIAEHDETIMLGDIPRCCERLLSQNRVCYGHYRPPSDLDIATVRSVREKMDRDGLVQRNDAERSQKILMEGALSTRHFIKRAREQQAQRVKDIMLANAESFFGDVPKLIGTTKTYKELEHIFKEGLDRQDEERFA